MGSTKANKIDLSFNEALDRLLAAKPRPKAAKPKPKTAKPKPAKKKRAGKK